MNPLRTTRWLILIVVIIAIAAIAWGITSNRLASEPTSLTELANEILAGDIKSIDVGSDGREISINYVDESKLPGHSRYGGTESFELLLAEYGVPVGTLDINYEQPSSWSGFINVAVFFLPLILIVGFFYYMFRQSQGSNNQAMSFGKSKARMFTGDHPTVTFQDVAGAEEAKEELAEIVEFLKQPEKFVNFGARIPKGVLLVGAPGTGKTLLAKAVSGEAGVPFFSIAGSEFVEMFVGVGASRVRDLFEQARRHSPCIIFVDEIDAVGRQRGAGLGGSHDEREQTLNQILVEMDGFSTDTHVIILAATNRPDILDPALMRPGRFDRRVVIDRPDIKGREAIFRVHMRGKPIDNKVKVNVLAKATPGFVGADIENTVNEAAILSARRSQQNISMNELQEAIERVQLGPERRSRVISPSEREITAYHEAGHAVVSHLLPHALTIRKVTIIPRGMAGGLTWYLEDDLTMYTRSKFKALICTALGGRVAEDIIYGEITTGASSDLRRVTQIARSMVTEYGMSEVMGTLVYGQKQEMVFLGREISESRDYSDAIAEQIDSEVRKIVDDELKRAFQLLNDHRDKLELVAKTLLEIETLEAEEFIALMETGELPPPPPSNPSPVAQRPITPVANDESDWEPPAVELPPAPAPA